MEKIAIKDKANINLYLNKKIKLNFKSVTSLEDLEMTTVLIAFIEDFNKNPKKHIRDFCQP